jgi:hypothetical protein
MLKEIILIAVYCGKATESWLSAEWIGLAGVITGAIIGFGGNFWLQRYVANRATQSENVKRKSDFAVKFLMQDIISFLDSEILYLQALSVSNKNKPDGVNGEYRWNVASVKTSMGIIGGQDLLNKFNVLLNFKTAMEDINSAHAENVKNIEGDKFKELEEAIKCVSEIKSSLWVKA